MSQTSVREIPITDGKGLKNFVALERRWVGTNPQYVSEIDADVIKGLSGRSRKFAESMGGTGRVLAHCYDKLFG